MVLDGVVPLGHGVVALSIGVPGVGVVDRGVLTVLTVVIGVVLLAGEAVAVDRRWWRDVYASAGRHETLLRGRSILDLPEAACVVDESVLAVDFAVGVLGFDFVAAVSSFEAVAVAAILVVSKRNSKRS